MMKSLIILKITFYPTYEEWKHVDGKQYKIVRKTFYPTYEEWKQRKTGLNKN